MNWTELLKSEIEHNYKVTQNLMDMVDADKLDWQPPIGNNWMTVRQLLQHLTASCGATFKGFITNQWGPPEGEEAAIQSVAEAKALLAKDKQLALDMLAQCSEERLATAPTPAPWDPTGTILGQRLLSMVQHLNQHKGQLFYYLKMQGKPVGTRELYGG